MQQGGQLAHLEKLGLEESGEVRPGGDGEGAVPPPLLIENDDGHIASAGCGLKHLALEGGPAGFSQVDGDGAVFGCSGFLR